MSEGGQAVSVYLPLLDTLFSEESLWVDGGTA